jgi:DNA (cytosine-5)-methyltransferase 1
MITSLDLFAGAGGLTLGLKNAGIHSIGAIEIDRFASETFRLNFPEIPQYHRDIYSFSDEEIRQRFAGVNMVVGGPPCQGFSVAGPSQYGKIDKRNTLIMEFFRFISVLQPDIAILENVKGILNGKIDKKNKALDVYTKELENIGYQSKVFVLQTADFGVPQHRERVIVISSRNPNLIPENIVGEYQNNWITVKDVFGDLPVINAGQGIDSGVSYYSDPQTEYQDWVRNGSQLVYNHIAMKHTPRLIERFKHIPQGCSVKDVAAEYGQRERGGSDLDKKQRFKMNNQRLHPNKVSTAVTASFQSTFVHPVLHRNLTAREGARLQSFPDTFIFCGPRTLMSKTLLIRENREDEIGLSQYNQIGNSVPPRMAESIGKVVLDKFRQEGYEIN